MFIFFISINLLFVLIIYLQLLFIYYILNMQ